MKTLLSLLFPAGLLVLPPGAAAVDINPEAYYFVTTSHSGAQTQIDENHTSTWDFTAGATQNFIFGGGMFVMKGGPATVADSALTITDNTTSDSLTVTHDQFVVLHGGNDQQYSEVDYLFSLMYDIVQNHSYTISLTSSAVDHQSTAYFIKGFETASFYQGGDTKKPLPSAPAATYDGDIYMPAPEPGSWILAAIGACMIGFSLFRRKE